MSLWLLAIPLAGLALARMRDKQGIMTPLGKRRTIFGNIKNIGNVKHTFTIGATVGKPGGGTGCTLWYDPDKPHIDLPDKDIEIKPGKTATVSWNFDDSDLDPSGNWGIVKVWKGPGETGCLDGDYDGFSVRREIKARVTRVHVS